MSTLKKHLMKTRKKHILMWICIFVLLNFPLQATKHRAIEEEASERSSKKSCSSLLSLKILPLEIWEEILSKIDDQSLGRLAAVYKESEKIVEVLSDNFFKRRVLQEGLIKWNKHDNWKDTYIFHNFFERAISHPNAERAFEILLNLQSKKYLPAVLGLAIRTTQDRPQEKELAQKWQNKAVEKLKPLTWIKHGAANSFLVRYFEQVGFTYDDALGFAEVALEKKGFYIGSNLLEKGIEKTAPTGSLRKAGELFLKSVEQGYLNTAAGKKKEAQGELLGFWQNFNGLLNQPQLALKYLQLAADHHLSWALFHLGNVYEIGGQGIEKDLAKALDYYITSANQKYTDAQIKLGYVYEEGLLGIQKNYEQSLNYYAKALKNNYSEAFAGIERLAEKGDTRARTNLGILYENSNMYDEALTHYIKSFNSKSGGISIGFALDRIQGLIVKGYSPALKWMEVQAMQGCSTAGSCLGKMYEEGVGVQKDYDKALEYYIKTGRGYNDCIINLGDIIRLKESGYNKAEEWLREQEEKIEDFVYRLGVLYEEGIWATRSYEKSLEFYIRAVNKNINNASYRISELARKGYVEARKWMEERTDKDGELAYNLGTMYEAGIGVEKDYEKAISYYHKAAQQNHAWALSNLGWHYYKNKDYQASISYYEKASIQGNEVAKHNIGKIYEMGLGVEQNYQMALKYYIELAEKDDERSSYYILELAKKGYSQAISWLEGRIEKDSWFKSHCGTLYEKGLGFPQNYEKAFSCYAVERNVEAIKRLAEQGGYIPAQEWIEKQKETQNKQDTNVRRRRIFFPIKKRGTGEKLIGYENEKS